MERLENGASLGPYRILHPIGEGGMARVYKAFQANMERYVALKVLPSHYAEEPQFVKRFIREARTIARLEHKNILPVYDFGEHSGITYLVMRYLEGGTLKDVLAQGRLTLHDILEILDQVCPALDYAHRNGVIHRDVKPSNIMIDSEGAAYLTDFGIAKVIGKASDLTATGAAIGTPAYMAPEQAIGDQVDARTDLYALGVVLYEMVVGRVPFQADTPMAVLLAHMHDPLPLPSQVDPSVHEAIEKVIIKALAKNPDDRYQSASLMLQALRQAVAAAAPASLETTLVNLLAEIKTNRGVVETARAAAKPAAEPDKISDPRLLEKLEQLYIDGLSAYWIQDWEKAQARLQEVNSFDPHYKDAAVRLAEIHKQRRLADLRRQVQEAMQNYHWQEAEEALIEILATAPDDPQAALQVKQVKQKLELQGLYDQAEQLFQGGQWAAVLKVFEPIHKLESAYPDPQNLLPQAQKALEQQQRLEKIKETYQSGLQALDKGEWKQAQKLFSQVKTQQPGYGETEQLLARASAELTRARQKPPKEKLPRQTPAYQQPAGKQPAPEASRPAAAPRRAWFKPWIALVGVVAVLAVVALVWFLAGLGAAQKEQRQTQEASALLLPTKTVAQPAPTKTSGQPVAPLPTQTEKPLVGPIVPDALQRIGEIYDDFSAPGGMVDPERWRLEEGCKSFFSPEGLVVGGLLQFVNQPAEESQRCELWMLASKRLPGEALGGISAVLHEQYQQGPSNSNTWVSILSEMGDGHILRAYCGLQSWPDKRLALFSVDDSQEGQLFYFDMEIDGEVPHKFRLQIDPKLMAIRCQVDEQSLGVWLPPDPERLRRAEFARLIETERLPGMVVLSTVDDVRLLPPRQLEEASCPETPGWRAEYWDNADLVGPPRVCRNEEYLRHFWVNDSPAPEIPNNWFSARYTRQVELESGHYTFRLSGDDGVRLWIDEILLIDEWQDQPFTDYYAEMEVPAGLHTLRVEYFDYASDALLELFVTREGQPLRAEPRGCVPPPVGLIGWWAGDGDATNEVNGPAGVWSREPSYAPGRVAQAFRFDPEGWDSGQANFIQVPPGSWMDYYGFSIEAWVFLDPDRYKLGVEENFIETGRFRLFRNTQGALVFVVNLDGEFSTPLVGPEPLLRVEWLHLAAVYDGLSMALYLNGREVASQEVSGALTTSPGFEDMWISNPNLPVSGLLDEISLYNRALSLGEIRWIYSQGEYGKCK